MTKKVTDDRLETCIGFVRYLSSRRMPGPGPLTIEAYEDIEAALVELQERRADEPRANHTPSLDWRCGRCGGAQPEHSRHVANGRCSNPPL
jgi:hypothetical protein